MLSERLQQRERGAFVEIGGGNRAFVPASLPPPLEYPAELAGLLESAGGALGRLRGLDELGGGVSLELMVAPYMRIEAVLSSRIEGTHTSLVDLLISEADHKASDGTDDLREVGNYVKAMRHGLNRLAEMPLCLRLVREIHSVLMTDVRGGHARPGRFREVQVYVGQAGGIGRASYVPPPATLIEPLMGEWEGFVQGPPNEMPVLVQCAAMHYQFEAIHPFADENGRVGRLLIALLLCSRQVLREPVLYLSAFFEAHRSEYYERLAAVSRDGDWRGWVAFFLRGVFAQATQAINCCREVGVLRGDLRGQIQRRTRSGNALALLDLLFENPFVTVPRAASSMGVSAPTARTLVGLLVDMGVLDELPGRKRNRLYRATRLLDVIQRAALPPDSEA